RHRSGSRPPLARASAERFHDGLVTPPQRGRWLEHSAGREHPKRTNHEPRRNHQLNTNCNDRAGAQRNSRRRPCRRCGLRPGAAGPSLVALDPATWGVERTPRVAADAAPAFDGKYLYQLVDARIDKIDPTSGEVVSSIPAPGDGCGSGMAWAEGTLWVGQYDNRKILQVDPETGKVLRTLESNRF